MRWKFFFLIGFIYSSCTVLFGWIASKVFHYPWFSCIIGVIVIDLGFRRILALAASQYLKRYKD